MRSRGSYTIFDASLKKDKCFICHKKGHTSRLPRQKEQEERQNEETPGEKVRLESADRGKLHDEVSSPAST
jgi:hypothetical protein